MIKVRVKRPSPLNEKGRYLNNKPYYHREENLESVIRELFNEIEYLRYRIGELENR